MTDWLFDRMQCSSPRKKTVVEELTEVLRYECDSPGLYEIREDLFTKAEKEIESNRERTRALDISTEEGRDTWDKLRGEVESIVHCMSTIRAKRLEKIIDIAHHIATGAADEWKEKNCAIKDELEVFTYLTRFLGWKAGEWGILQEDTS